MTFPHRLRFRDTTYGAFDVVHARFLEYTFRKTEWEAVLRNVIAL
jgi:hypothetical protein